MKTRVGTHHFFLLWFNIPAFRTWKENSCGYLCIKADIEIISLKSGRAFHGDIELYEIWIRSNLLADSYI